MQMFFIYLIIIFLNIYVLSKILNRKSITIRNIIGTLIIVSIIIILKHYGINKNYISPILYLLLFLFNILIYHLNVNKSFISVILLFIINMICEIFISLIFIILNIELGLIANILIAISPILLVNIIGIKKIRLIIIENSRQYIIPTLLIILLILYFIIIKNIFVKNSILIMFSIIFTLIIIILLAKNIMEKQKISILNERYNESLSTILKYEKIIEEKMKMTHEYKNNLLLIKSMLGKKDKKVHDYIQNLLDSNITKLDNKLLDQMNRIPFKTFSGMLYYKISQAEENNINVVMDISNNIKKLNSNTIGEKTINDICKLTSIFMDNAIDASEKVKEKTISLSMYINNNKFIISIANKFNGVVCDKNIRSTKGKWHGYGLEIAKDIMKKNRKIKNTTEYISNVFIQNIIINLDK